MVFAMRMFSIFMYALSLGLALPVTTKDTIEDLKSFETQESSNRTVLELSSMSSQLIPSVQESQLSNIVKMFLDLYPSVRETESGIDDFSLSSTVKISRLNHLSVVSTITETLKSSFGFDSLASNLKTVNGESERLTIEPGTHISGARNNNDITQDVIKTLLPNINKADLKLLLDVIIKMLHSSGIFEKEQFPDSLNYLSGIKPVVDNRDEYMMPPHIVPLDEKSTANRDSELHFFDKISNKEHSKNEGSDLITKSPSESKVPIKSKRSISKESTTNDLLPKSLYSIIIDARSSSPPLDDKLNLLSSHDLKKTYYNIFSTISMFLERDRGDLLFNELSEAIETTFSHLTPVKVFEALVNAIEHLVLSAIDATAKQYEDLFKSYVDELKEAAESMNPNEDEYTQINTLVITLYSFLLNENIAEAENLETLIKMFISEIYAFSGMSKSKSDT